MWSVMLVDDEPTVVEGLQTHIDWNSLDARVECVATSGQEALALFQAHRPNLVITDMYMPGMDGLQLMQAIHDMEPATVFVVLSGYDEFEYARRSLKFGAVDYILKPASLPEITTVLGRAVAKCREGVLRRRLEAQLPFLREHYLIRLLREEPDTEEARFLEMTCQVEGTQSVAVISVDRPRSMSEAEWQLVRLQVREAAAKPDVHVLPYLGGEVPVLLGCIEHPSDWCKVLLEELRVKCPAPVTIGLSRPCPTIREAYAEARQAMAYREILGSDRVIDIDRVDLTSDAIPPYPVDRNPRLLEALRFGDEPEVRRQVQEALLALKDAPVHYVRGACIELYGMGATALSERGQSMEEVWPPKEFWDNITTAGAVPAITGIMADRLGAVALRLNVRQKTRHMEVLNEIDRIIASRYAEDLTMEEVARAVYLSRTYVAYLFKQVRGCSFLEHLTKVRMTRARELLITTTLSVYEVAEKVGYKNAAYFSRVFRDHFGKMPSELRRGSA